MIIGYSLAVAVVSAAAAHVLLGEDGLVASMGDAVVWVCFFAAFGIGAGLRSLWLERRHRLDES